jgi:anti-sigma regulatory factor (Ser/Thr protein kinase)
MPKEHVATDLDETLIQAGHHVVQFYERDENLALAVSSFLGAGLIKGEAALIVATPEHQAAFEAVLLAAGVDLPSMRLSGAFECLDAAEVLSSFMVDGEPDPQLFDSTVGVLVRQTAAGRPIRIYGEMVALLWDQGAAAAAITLEALWNDLGSRQEFSLFCAYPAAVVAGHPGGESEICSHHSTVIPEVATQPGTADSASQVFEPTRFAAPAARRFVMQTLQDWGFDELIDSAALVVSELATNAVIHAGERFHMTVTRRSGDVVRVAVTDRSSTGPTVRSDRRLKATNGRGMHLIAAAAVEWGIDSLPHGKTVWADLARSAADLPD